MKMLSKGISWVVLILLIIGILIFVLPQLFGIKLFNILTGSMAPAYSPGDLIYVLPTDYEEIKPGDTITYVINEDGMVVTHRVIEKDDETQYLVTKGDANMTPDINPIMFENVVGKVGFNLPQLGKVIEPLGTLQGKIIFGGIVLVSVILMYLLPLVLRKHH